MNFLEEVKSFVIPSPTNPNYGDAFVYQDLVKRYGKEKVDAAIKKIEEK